MFTEVAAFGGATFAGKAWFGAAAFVRGPGFNVAKFARDAWFGAAMFAGSTSFSGATFGDEAFGDEARFDGAVVRHPARMNSVWPAGWRVTDDHQPIADLDGTWHRLIKRWLPSGLGISGGHSEPRT